MDNLSELYVLSFLLCIDDIESQIFALLDETDFESESVADIFTSFRRYYDKHGNVDSSAVVSLSDSQRVLTLQAVNILPTKMNWKQYCEAVKEASTLRKAKSLSASLAYANDIEDIRDKASKILQTVNGASDGKSEGMESLTLSFLKRKSEPREYIKAGYATLDNYIQIEKGDFDIIAARPSVGKTALAINIMLNMAKKGHRVAFFSLETSYEKVFDRIASTVTGVNFGRIKRQSMDEHDWSCFMSCADELSKLPIDIIKASGQSVAWIRGEALRLKAEIVFIDYLQLINGKGSGRYEEVTNTSMELHNMAQQTGISVFALAQINRSGAKRPSMADIKDSGQIEQDADVIIILHRPEENRDDVDVIVDKNKEGEVGTVKMKFDGGRQRFYEVSKI